MHKLLFSLPEKKPKTSEGCQKSCTTTAKFLQNIESVVCVLQLKYICDVTLSERSTHTNSAFLIQRPAFWVSLCFSLQSVWTTRLYTWCPSPATANKSVLLLWPTRPLGTPAFQEPGSTSVWSILVVGLSSFTRCNYGPRINQTDGFKHRNRLPWYGSLTSRLFLFFTLFIMWQWTFSVFLRWIVICSLSHQLFLSHPTIQ